MILTHKQKIAVKKALSPLYRIATGSKKIDTRYNYIEFGKPRCHTYFGYYDVTPFQGEKVIYIEREKGSSVCKVVLNDIHNTSKQYLADSRAWNWQQGIRLRWFPTTENVISFNDYIGGQYINRIVNIETKEEKRLDWPLYDIDSKGKLGLTLDFERLGVMHPGYGYTCEPYKAGDLWQNGISIIDIEKNQLVRKITYKELSDNIKKADDINRFYLSHLTFSPDGTKVALSLVKNGITNIYEYDITAKTLRQLTFGNHIDTHYRYRIFRRINGFHFTFLAFIFTGNY